MHRIALVLIAAVALAVTVAPQPVEAIGGEGEAWPAFTESTSCGAVRMSPPRANEPGWLDDDTLLRGDFAAMFGRSVKQVRESLIRWPIPGSSKVLAVHPSMLSALEQASAQIKASIADGDQYLIDGRSTFSAAARTIRSSVRISLHTFGNAFDFNSQQNPYRGDNELITDMPDWWVQAFLDAGFCWGGLWIGSKDAMHFAWQGPIFSDYEKLPEPYVPLTDALPFVHPAVSIRVEPQEIGPIIATVLTDIDGNGAIDVVRVTDRGPDVLIDASVASRRHNACSTRRWLVSGAGDLARSSVALGFGDLDGRGGQDLWIATEEDGKLRITVRWAFGGYSAETTRLTEIPIASESAWIGTADYDVDGDVDLYIIDGDSIEVWELTSNDGGAARLFSGRNPFPRTREYFLGDSDLDMRPDIWAIRGGVVSTSVAADGYETIAVAYRPVGFPTGLLDVRAADYDGDGRLDLITFDGISKQVWLGNTPLPDGLEYEVWFEYEDPDCEDGEQTWDRQELRFAASTWIANGSYQWRVRHGLTVGCNPSEEACDVGVLTREMFSEFLAWIDGLEPGEGSSVFPAGWALETAGYVPPCAVRDRACWAEPIPQSELASSFGQFLSLRRGGVPAPDRWVPSLLSPPSPDRSPR